MTGLLKSLLQITLLRRDPSALPASIVLLILLATAYAISSALQSWMLHGGDRLLVRTAADLGLTLVTFWLVLAVTRRGHRYRQTISAVLGAAVLMTPLVLLLLALKDPAAVSYPVALLAWAGSVGVIVWFTLIVAHILKSALEVGFVTSIAIAITYLLTSAAVLTRLFPESA
jgi:hypothetical protein